MYCLSTWHAFCRKMIDAFVLQRERLKTYEELIARKDKELSKLRTKAKVKNDVEIQVCLLYMV